MTAGEMLKAWRAARGLKQREAAALIGCSQAMLGKLEGNDSLPGVENAVAIERLTEGAIPCEAWRKEPRPGAPSDSGEHPAVDPADADAAAGAS